MKILCLTWEYPPHLEGGLGQHVKELTPALLRNSPALELHVVTPVFSGATSHETLGRLTIHRVAVPAPAAATIYADVVADNPALAKAAAEVIRAYGPFDLIHVHDWLPSFAARELQATFGLPLVVTIHATERGRYRGALYSEMSRAIDAAEERLAQEATRVITCSQAMQMEVHSFYHVPSGQIVVVPNGIDGRHLRRLRGRDLSDFRSRYAQPHQRIVFNVGRMVYEKGADLLVEAAPLVLSRTADVKFVIGGRGPLFDALRQRIADLRLTEHVLLSGFLTDDERDRLYVVADVCVFPSRYEPFGIVALEAMAAGTPVVVSDVGGLGTVVQHGLTGLTTYPEDVRSLAWAIQEVLDHPEAAQERAARASAHVKEHLNWDVIACMTLQVYEDVRLGVPP
ncbi:MAG TPA: glycosyltransferase family 4 protein [Anaerolineae bacterium]|nr:glycosyltransferase family 4 protein [Anaerolineae bacterium]HNU04740.1 glycosyltransferase family 4 protein [Anaerolineae bacterium]